MSSNLYHKNHLFWQLHAQRVMDNYYNTSINTENIDYLNTVNFLEVYPKLFRFILMLFVDIDSLISTILISLTHEYSPTGPLNKMRKMLLSSQLNTP